MSSPSPAGMSLMFARGPALMPYLAAQYLLWTWSAYWQCTASLAGELAAVVSVLHSTIELVEEDAETPIKIAAMEVFR